MHWYSNVTDVSELEAGACVHKDLFCGPKRSGFEILRALVEAAVWELQRPSLRGGGYRRGMVPGCVAAAWEVAIEAGAALGLAWTASLSANRAGRCEKRSFYITQSATHARYG